MSYHLKMSDNYKVIHISEIPEKMEENTKYYIYGERVEGKCIKFERLIKMISVDKKGYGNLSKIVITE